MRNIHRLVVTIIVMCSINNMGQAEGRTDCHSDKKCLCDVEHQGNVRGIIIQFPFKYTCNF